MPPLSWPAGGSQDTPRYVLQWVSDFALAKWVHQPYWPLEDLNISPEAKLTATSTASRNFPQPAPSSAERRRRFGGERSPVHSRDAAGSLRGSEMRSHRHFACPVQPQASKRLSWPFFRTHMSLGLDAQHLKPYGHKSLKLSPSRATSQFWLKKSPSFWCSTFIEINVNFLGLNPALSKNWRYPTLWSYHAVSRKWMEMMQHQTRGFSMVISTTRTPPDPPHVGRPAGAVPAPREHRSQHEDQKAGGVLHIVTHKPEVFTGSVSFQKRLVQENQKFYAGWHRNGSKHVWTILGPGWIPTTNLYINRINHYKPLQWWVFEVANFWPMQTRMSHPNWVKNWKSGKEEHPNSQIIFLPNHSSASFSIPLPGPIGRK